MSNPSDKTRSRLQGIPGAADQPHLLAVWPGGSNRLVLPPVGVIVVGRGAECALRVVDASVSRAHVRIHVTAAGVALEDLGSSNGTLIAGVRAPPHKLIPLGPGAVAEVGDAVLMLQGLAPAPLVALPQLETRSHDEAHGATTAMVQIQKLADIVATSDLNVILQGETGVGKEVLARRIHDLSPRRTGPFLKLNCAAFAETMVEAELFGHEKGAFTGAVAGKPGLIEAATGGTLLLDEVAELTAGTQAKLLRAVGNLEVIRIGSVIPRAIDVRFVAATHDSFNSLIESGRFRQDLFYRLNGVTLTIPPLRQRQDEIAPLARGFLSAWCQRHHRAQVSLAPDGLAWLCAQTWRGNIRELKSTVERAALLGGGPRLGQPEFLAAAALAGSFTVPPPLEVADSTTAVPEESATLRDELSRIERDRIVAAIAQCAGNQTKAAALLGMSRRALLHKLDAYELPRPRKDVATNE